MPWSGLVAGSLWNVKVSTKNKVSTVQVEEYQPPVDNHQLCLLHQMQMSGDLIQGRVLSWPKVVCRQGDILVCQLITHKVDHMQFLVIDLVKRQFFVFTDTVKHLLRSYALMGSVECCLSPDLHMLLLRLPREVARSRAASLVLIGRPRSQSKPITIGENPVETTLRSQFHDRKHYMLLFDPRLPRRLVSVYVNEFGSKCMVMSRDQDRQETVLRKTIHIGQLNAIQVTVADYLSAQIHHDDEDEEEEDGNSEDDDDDDDDPLMVFKMVSCKAEFSRSADYLVLCCLVEDAVRGGFYIRLFLFDSTTFTLILKCHQRLDAQDPTESVGAFQIVFSPCDTRVHIVTTPGDRMGHLACSMDLVCTRVSLSSFCRSTVLKHLSNSQDVDSLPVPSSIKRYLKFQDNKYGHDSQCVENNAQN